MCILDGINIYFLISEFESKIISHLVPEYFVAIIPLISRISGSGSNVHPEVRVKFCFSSLSVLPNVFFFSKIFHCFSDMRIESEYQNLFSNVVVF